MAAQRLVRRTKRFMVAFVHEQEKRRPPSSLRFLKNPQPRIEIRRLLLPSALLMAICAHLLAPLMLVDLCLASFL